MKQISAKSKIMVAIIILIIVIGAAVVGTQGFSFDLKNQTSQMIELKIGKEFEISDIQQIASEVLENEQVLIQKVEVYEDSVAITAKQISDDQKSKLVEKINEKYETKLKAEDIDIKNIPHTKLRDMVKPYILPLVISTVIILAYSGIRFSKLGIIKTILKIGGIEVLAELLLFSIMAISRFPIGRYALPLVLFVYLVTMLGITLKLEKQLSDKKEEEKNN